MEKTLNEIREVVALCKFPGLDLNVAVGHAGVWFVQVGGPAPFSPVDGTQKGRKWLLSSHMTVSEIVQTTFKALFAFVEHEVREKFTYREQSVFNPHVDMDFLASLHATMKSGLYDVRPDHA